jgi:RHS repeat-associated protein
MSEIAASTEPSYYRARYYNPAEGRFLSEDPITFRGGVNFYRYSSNNSVNFVDPFGLNPVPAIPWPWWPWPVFPGRAIGEAAEKILGKAIGVA